MTPKISAEKLFEHFRPALGCEYRVTLATHTEIRRLIRGYFKPHSRARPQ